jgi:predicted O-methyltransferase YrrM
LTPQDGIPMIAAMTDGFFKRPPHHGRSYQKILGILHDIRHPKTYLEIGTATGQTLAIAKCASIAIDPHFRLTHDVRQGKPACHLFETTSDAFFATQDPRALLGAPLDLAFIDGMHHYEFALRDFMNVERSCRPNSMIVLHDCLPVDSHMARREPRDKTFAALADHPEAWAGDTWKAVWILQRYRPDLRLYAFDAPPSGLVVMTGLQPDSTTLRVRYQEAVDAAASVTLERFYAGLEIRSTAVLRRPRRMLGILPGLRPFDFARFVRA